jgi:hypothetical protein
MEYLDQIRSSNTSADPESTSWIEKVESDPIYRWFIAGETTMAAGCSNAPLKGTTGSAFDIISATLIQTATDPWCTKYNKPFEKIENRTQQYFAKMWFDLLVDSPSFLNLRQGKFLGFASYQDFQRERDVLTY